MINLSPLIEPIQILLKSLPAFRQKNASSQLDVICKLAESALSPLVQIISKYNKQDRPTTDLWGTLFITSCQLDLACSPPLSGSGHPAWFLPSNDFTNLRHELPASPGDRCERQR